MKKFAILLIITFLSDTQQFSPEVAATVLLLFLCFAMNVAAVYEPLTSSLVNKAHLACDFLIIFVLLTGLLSTSAGRMWPGEAETMSIIVVSYAACLIAAIAVILVIEVGGILRTGGTFHAVWKRFSDGSPAHIVAVAARRGSALVSRLSFSGVAPEPAPTDGGPTITVLAAAVETISPHSSPADPSDPRQLATLKKEYTVALRKMREDIASLASIAVLVHVDDDGKLQLENCAANLEMLAEKAEAYSLEE